MGAVLSISCSRSRTSFSKQALWQNYILHLLLTVSSCRCLALNSTPKAMPISETGSWLDKSLCSIPSPNALQIAEQQQLNQDLRDRCHHAGMWSRRKPLISAWRGRLAWSSHVCWEVKARWYLKTGRHGKAEWEVWHCWSNSVEACALRAVIAFLALTITLLRGPIRSGTMLTTLVCYHAARDC